MNRPVMDDFNQRLRHRAKDFGPQLAKLTFERGLAVTGKDGSRTPIPVTATPVIVDEDELKKRVEITAQLMSAGFKMARAMLQGPDRPLLIDALSPIERKVLEATEEGINHLANTRVDFFVTDKAWALELNTTIPAMQGYSDIAANSFIEAVGREAGMPPHVIAKVQARNGSNAMALYRALLDTYAKERQGELPRRIAMLCRRNDAQLTELSYLRDRFNEWGTEAAIVYPDELSGDEVVMAHGKEWDLVYRHLFVRRLEELDSPYLVDLFSTVPGKKCVLVNPPNAQIENKAVFAMLSQAVTDHRLAREARLSENELGTVLDHAPWTRLFRKGPATDPDRKKVDDLVARVAAEPERFVLKRAWDYGGKAVFVGRGQNEPSFAQRVTAAYGGPLSWADLCARAAEDRVGGGFVVQEIVPTVPENHLLVLPEGGVIDVDLYVDFSAYASVNLKRQPAWGGVCRGSPSQIVNILGGGGVLPLISRQTAKSLYDAMLAWGRF